MPPRKRHWMCLFCAPALFLALSAGFSGCASTTRYTVKIDAAANPAVPSGYSYALASRDPGRMRDARYANVIERVHVALSQRGMYEAPNPAKADVIIDVDYGELPPQSKVTTVTQPVVLQPDPLASSYPTPYGSSYPPGPGIDPITGQPRSQVAMVQTQRITYTTEKYIRISARENAAAQGKSAAKANSAWTVEATLEDENSDFDAALPAMIDAAIEYMGTNTGGQVSVKVDLG